MTTLPAMDIIAPLVIAAPNPVTDDFFTPAQWATLMAIMDTTIPSFRRVNKTTFELGEDIISDEKFEDAGKDLRKTVTNAPDNSVLEEYLAERPSDSEEFQDMLRRALLVYSKEDSRNGLKTILAALNTRLGSRILTGYAQPIQEQPFAIRTAILQSWRLSYLPPLRVIYRGLTMAAKNTFIKTSLSFPKATGYVPFPDHYKPGPHFEYEFMQFPAGEEPVVLETDVIIVGSGCGGGVCAKNLAEAGHKVMVVDKSYYFTPSQLPMSEGNAGINLYENGGLEASVDGSMSVLAGSCWGGGGTVNWSASLQTQDFVRKEWAEDRGLTFFGSQEYQDCMDRVCGHMGVGTDHIRHNHGNRVILEGSKKLGWPAKEVPQNTGGNEHYCGHCTLGCGAAQKQGPVVAWLPDAQKAGAKFMEGFHVDKVLFEEVNGVKTAVGVQGVWTSRGKNGTTQGPLSDKTIRPIIVRAKKVIISSGTLWSPMLLLKSGLTNKHIGKNLYLHPVNFIAGIFPEDIRPWEGGILTTVCSEFENLDNKGHGVKLEAMVMMPSWTLTPMNWKDGYDWKMQTLKYRHQNSYISITRDRDTGSVFPDKSTGQPTIAYTPSKFDSAHTMEGVIAVAKLCYVQNAQEIHVFISGNEPFYRYPDGVCEETAAEMDARFRRWCDSVRAGGNAPPKGIWASAHQMGTNRMATNEKDGVVDPNGKVFGTEGLYVSDASVFPSASGVNPMITNMAISDYISTGIAKLLHSEKV